MTSNGTIMAAAARIDPVAGNAGQFRIEGDLDFASVPALYSRALELFVDCPRITLDLAGVTHANSAALALLLEWQGQARRAGRALVLQNVPARLINLARVSELEEVLPLSGAVPASGR